jgi:N4-gp56 family major capsid protein
MMGPAIQTIWSKEILFQSMPVLRFEQFAVKKTELGVMPGLTVNFMRYNNLPIPSGALVEGVRMKTYAISAQQYAITVAEQGFAVAVSELLLNASFDDVMASASRLMGRNMALYMDTQARGTLQRASSVVFGYEPPATVTGGYGIYSPGNPGKYWDTTSSAGVGGTGGLVDQKTSYFLHPYSIKDASEVLASKNIPRLGETYVCFAHPHQTRRLRDTPEWIEITKYAAPGNFMLGEVGRYNDVVFIETTQITAPIVATVTLNGALPTVTSPPSSGQNPGGSVADPGGGSSAYAWRTTVAGTAYPTAPAVLPAAQENVTDGSLAGGAGAGQGTLEDGRYGTGASEINLPGWGQAWSSTVYEAIMMGDNAFGHAVSLPVELRDGGVLDFGREHALAWYSIWGFGLVTESAVCKIVTN